MSEVNGKAGDGADAAIDLSKYVPKGDFEKVASSVKELESQLEKAKMTLLDPEYIAFQESKNKKVEASVNRELSKISDSDLAHLNSKQILEIAVERARDAVAKELTPIYEKELNGLKHTLSDVLAVLEVQEAEKKHKDFDEFRDATRKILESSSTPLTIEQAYLIAKAGSTKEPEGKAKEPEKLKGTEKPSGTVPSDDMGKSKFSSKEAASQDAWDKVVGAGKGQL